MGNRDISWQRAFALASIPTAICVWGSLAPWGESLDSRVMRPIEFKLRHVLGKDPELDPRIKIYAFDDTTVEYIKDVELNLNDWGKILASFNSAKPSSVFVDKIFAMPRGIEQAPRFISTLKGLSFPVIAGAYLVQTPVPLRTPLNLQRNEYQLAPDIPIMNSLVYGPNSEIVPAFKYLGHLVWRETAPFVQALYRINETVAIPSAGLLVTGKPEIQNGKLFVNSKPVGMDARGRILNNLVPWETYASKTYSLKSVIEKARANQQVTTLPKDAVVILLPSHMTGSTDMVITPFGILPGGYWMTAIINSALSGKWLSVMPQSWAAVVFCGALGTAAGVLLPAVAFWVSIVVGLFGLVSAGIVSFSYFDFELPWLFASVNFFGAALFPFLDKMRMIEKRAERLRQALDGAVSPERIEHLVQTNTPFSLVPSGQVVTIMFLDVVGFSKLAEKLKPEEAFQYLKSIMVRLAHTVHAHGGIVDKTIGDGMLCFFGYTFKGEKQNTEHAVQALKCATQIQRDNLVSNIKKFDLSSTIMNPAKR